MIPPCLTEIDSTTHIDTERMELESGTLWKEKKEEYLNLNVKMTKFFYLTSEEVKLYNPKTFIGDVTMTWGKSIMINECLL